MQYNFSDELELSTSVEHIEPNPQVVIIYSHDSGTSVVQEHIIGGTRRHNPTESPSVPVEIINYHHPSTAFEATPGGGIIQVASDSYLEEESAVFADPRPPRKGRPKNTKATNEEAFILKSLKTERLSFLDAPSGSFT